MKTFSKKTKLARSATKRETLRQARYRRSGLRGAIDSARLVEAHTLSHWPPAAHPLPRPLPKHIKRAADGISRSSWRTSCVRLRVWTPSILLGRCNQTHTFVMLQNAEIFTLTYGSIVRQLITDVEDIAEVNKQLDTM